MKSHELAKLLLSLPDLPVYANDSLGGFGRVYEVGGVWQSFMKNDRVVDSEREYEKIFSRMDDFETCDDIIKVELIKIEDTK
jgi:hypothetical protein